MGQRIIPLESVGVYVPGGKAAYPSSVLMNVIPAKVAGVKNIIIVTPPKIDGKINKNILAAAKIAGVDKIFKIGGAQAIGALAYGTESIPRVLKIVGPGNAYVAEAKRMVFGAVDIDMIAGPSEILIIADEKANAKFIAADLMSQAEHDERASSILLTTSLKLAKKVIEEISIQIKDLNKKDIIEKSLRNYGKAIVCTSIENAINIAKEFIVYLQTEFRILAEKRKINDEDSSLSLNDCIYGFYMISKILSEVRKKSITKLTSASKVILDNELAFAYACISVYTKEELIELSNKELKSAEEKDNIDKTIRVDKNIEILLPESKATLTDIAMLFKNENCVCEYQKIGDRCFIFKLFLPARLFFSSASNFRALVTACVRVGDFCGAIIAALKVNNNDVYEEVLINIDLAIRFVTTTELDLERKRHVLPNGNYIDMRMIDPKLLFVIRLICFANLLSSPIIKKNSRSCKRK